MEGSWSIVGGATAPETVPCIVLLSGRMERALCEGEKDRMPTARIAFYRDRPRGVRDVQESRRPRRSAHAQSVVEFALVTPIFMALLFGCLDVGIAFKTRSSYSEAVLQAVRVAAAAGQATDADAQTLHAFQSTLSVENLNDIASITIMDATASSPTPTIANTYVYSSTTKMFVCSTDCSGASPWAPSKRSSTTAALQTVAVEVTYRFRSVLNLIPAFQMTAIASAVIEPTGYGT